MRLFTSIVTFLMVVLLVGCSELLNELETDNNDTTPPPPIESAETVPGDKVVTLAWAPPTDDDVAHIEVAWTPGSGERYQLDPEANRYQVHGLTNGTEYTFTIVTVDAVGNRSEERSINEIPVAPDTTPPSDVSEFAIAAEGDSVQITWTDPPERDLDHIQIDWSPASPGPRVVNPGRENYVADQLTMGTEYTFTVKTVDRSGNKSEGRIASATPGRSLDEDGGAGDNSAGETESPENATETGTGEASTTPGDAAPGSGDSTAVSDGPAENESSTEDSSGETTVGNDSPDDQTLREDSSHESLAGDAGGAVTMLANAHSRIDGPDFGKGTPVTSKRVPLINDGDTSYGLSLPSRVTVIRRPYSDDGFDVLFEVTNVSTNSYIFVKLDKVKYYDTLGRRLNGTDDYTFSRGAVGQTSVGYTNTALFPGDRGLVLLYNEFYERLGSIHYELSVLNATIEPAATVYGMSYSYSEGDFASTMSVDYRNGPVAIEAEPSVLYASSSDAGVFFDWGFFSSDEFEPSDGILSAGESGKLHDDIFLDNHSASAMNLVFDFVPYSALSASSVRRNSVDASANKYERDRTRNAALNEIMNKLKKSGRP